MSITLYFNTVNQIKVKEIEEIFAQYDAVLKFLSKPIIEILSSNIEEVIQAKAADAYKKCRVPVIVEHGALSIDYFNGFPGALSKPMWDLMGEKICSTIPKGETRKATAISGVCYCDGKTRIAMYGHREGEIANRRKGSNGFQWDSIFIPQGETRTYAEMSQTEKLALSQAAIAYRKLQNHFDQKKADNM